MTENKTKPELSYDSVLADPTVSYWLKERIEELKERDPVDALNDIEVLKHLTELRLEELA